MTQESINFNKKWASRNLYPLKSTRRKTLNHILGHRLQIKALMVVMNISRFHRSSMDNDNLVLKGYGPQPFFVIDLDKATKQNDAYRTTLWTGEHLQLTLMSININDDIGLEIHPNIDQKPTAES